MIKVVPETRLLLENLMVSKCIPRLRGVVPTPCQGIMLPKKYSPHTRGCSGTQRVRCSFCTTFTTYVGLFRWAHSTKPICAHIPRIRGVDPFYVFGAVAKRPVFPAYAGLFPRHFLRPPPAALFPRVRGVVPTPGRRLGS